MNSTLLAICSAALVGLSACQSAHSPAPPPPIQRHGLPSELLTEGSVGERQSTQTAELVLFYSGEHQGSLETCGCPKRPRGSVPRLQSYLHAHQSAHPESATLLVNGGWWLSDALGQDGALRADAPVMNRHLVESFERVGMDAANLSYLDLPGLEEQPIPDFAVSANVKSEKAIATHLLLERGGQTIAITGITKQDQSFSPSPSFRIEDPVASAISVLEPLTAKADVLILLAFDAAEEAQAIAQAVPELDILVDTRQNRQHGPPLKMGDTLWVKSHYQTMRLGELRMNTTSSGVDLVVDRKIDLDSGIADDPERLRDMEEAREAINAEQAKLFGLVE